MIMKNRKYFDLGDNILVGDCTLDVVNRVIDKVKAEKPNTYTDYDIEMELKSLGYDVYVIDTFGDIHNTNF